MGTRARAVKTPSKSIATRHTRFIDEAQSEVYDAAAASWSGADFRSLNRVLYPHFRGALFSRFSQQSDQVIVCSAGIVAGNVFVNLRRAAQHSKPPVSGCRNLAISSISPIQRWASHTFSAKRAPAPAARQAGCPAFLPQRLLEHPDRTAPKIIAAPSASNPFFFHGMPSSAPKRHRPRSTEGAHRC